MNRSGYHEDFEDILVLGRWRGQVASAIRGKRGQAFLRELADAMDAMEEKVLIRDELVNEEGDCCAIGAVCLKRGLDTSKVDIEDPEAVGSLVGIAHQMASEIEYVNDEEWYRRPESPEGRWIRVRKWVSKQIRETSAGSSDATNQTV